MTSDLRLPSSLSYSQMTFLPLPSMRQILAVPTQDKVDFRAACFCHKTIVDIGFVCSVCLSSMSVLQICRLRLTVHAHTVFCQPTPVCSTCRCVHATAALITFIWASPSDADVFLIALSRRKCPTLRFAPFHASQSSHLFHLPLTYYQSQPGMSALTESTP